MKSIINRICSWNDARYGDQPIDIQLTIEFLDEEIQEYSEATEKVDQLDALIDVCYFAIGAIRKMGLSPGQINEAFNVVCDSNDTKPIVKTPSHIKANIDKGLDFIPPEPRLQEILDERS